MHDRNTETNWLNYHLTWAPPWAVSLIILFGSAVLALLVFKWVYRLIAMLARRFGPFVSELVRRTEGPVCIIWLTMVLGAVVTPAGFSPVATAAIAELLLVAFILAIGWAALIALDLGSEIYLHRFRIDSPDNLLARKHVTQVRILRRAAQTLIGLITISAALMTFAAVRQYGVSLFASAGAASLVVGLSARPVLSNLIAGVQIAITQPIRLEDAVVVEGEWGWIETIASTYVVIRIWDLRRLVVPLTYFIEKPFQNWTKEKADLLGSILLYVDYSVPVESLRQKLKEIVKASPLWDGKVVVLQVVDATDKTLQLRALVSARNSGQAWDLRCEVREKLIGFLQQMYPGALPHQRLEWTDNGFHRSEANFPSPAETQLSPRQRSEVSAQP